MRKIIYIVFIVLLFAKVTISATVYVDSDCSNGISTYAPGSAGSGGTCTGGSDTVYSTIANAVAGISGTGNIIYMRTGTYNEYNIDIPESTNGTSWGASNHNTLASFPGEWAVIDGSGAGTGEVIRHVTGHSGSGSNPTKYWKFERFEIDCSSEAQHAFLFTAGPIWIRYMYIHDLLYPGSGDDLVAAIWINVSTQSIIEYNYFKDVSATSPTTNVRHIAFDADQKDNTSNDGNGEEFDPDVCVNRNIVRYNYISGGVTGIHPKAQQRYGYNDRNPNGMSDYEEWGDKYHHNVVLGTSGASIVANSDFTNIYNNIVDGTIESEANKHIPQIYNHVIYNNTTVGGNSEDPSYYITSGINTGGEGLAYNNYYDDGDQYTVHPHIWMFNNISSGTGSGYHELPYLVIWDMPSDSSNPDTDQSDLVIENNLIHDADLDDAIIVGRLVSGTGCDHYLKTVAEFNACSDTWRSTSGVTNWDINTAGLFVGGGGANDYITVGSYVISGATTIANGGKGGAHPYRSGVTIPSYVGATNPDDNSWVAGVMAMDVDYFTSQTAGSDPTWIEGESEPEVPANAIQGMQISNIGVTNNLIAWHRTDGLR